ncbi:unnamed protein product [Didymodactylos carnosus]|uniref:Uncharacterized protein n=1 Tax=Didymodactylos carnosus TaxID=1234261 RepID=A0A816ANF1_9BILA|nr:unnamed protein product [Didymodactylos carnosus]CAF4476581.1 unnamed protein product [Didymodactylos carnosus]
MEIYHLPKVEQIELNVYIYDEVSYCESKYFDVNDIPIDVETQNETKCLWIEVNGIKDKQIIHKICEIFNLHTLVQDDIQTINQRMKLDMFDDGIYLLMKTIYLLDDVTTETQQISFYLKENVLLTFYQRSTPHLFAAIKQRLAKKPPTPANKNGGSRGSMKTKKADYLFYCLINVIIENYMLVLDSILTQIDYIDKQLMFKNSSKLNADTLKYIFSLKHTMLHFKVQYSPLKDIIIKLIKTQEHLLKRQRPKHRSCAGRRHKRRITRPAQRDTFNLMIPTLCDCNEDTSYSVILNDYIYIYFKSLHDHAIQLDDTIDSYAEMLASLIDFYMILNGDYINSIVQILTMTSALFMPLTFLCSLCSMNYEYMPQIPFKFGYLSEVILMVCVAFVMLIVFKIKKLI